jgi:hypothetical protein
MIIYVDTCMALLTCIASEGGTEECVLRFSPTTRRTELMANGGELGKTITLEIKAGGEDSMGQRRR